MEKVFKSGDEVGTDVRCYNCGRLFRDSKDAISAKKGDVVVCSCGGRCAYVIEEKK